MDEDSLAEVFRDARSHREIADIIIRHLLNEEDIRIIALRDHDLSGSRDILDLGCGFGFFTETLKGRVHHEARITGIDQYPEYKGLFLQSSDRAGIHADFLCEGANVISSMDENSFDLILCSYAMYFFPEVIQHVSRILRPEGLFIAITHEVPHMTEFTAYVRDILKKYGHDLISELPYELLIGKFSDKNGPGLLRPYFSSIKMKSYKGILSFGRKDRDDLAQYFDFKHSFYIPDEIDPDDKLRDMVVESIKEDIPMTRVLNITKNDVIFTCKGPKTC